MRIFTTADPELDAFLRNRGVALDDSLRRAVEEIIADVRQRGDEALLDSARKYDAPGLQSLLASQEEIDEAMPQVEHSFALDHAIERVKDFHEAQLRAITAGWQAEPFLSVSERQRHGQQRHHQANYRWTWN
ncbi:MAG TPA: histidinol dehydrogenase, partial [Fimbriimonadaceae bacterium]|nr:histidinol dehydrogenase [Fimbriimonadaceae bacterium]